MKIGVVIPACDEEATVGQIVRRCRKSATTFGSARIVVADNTSRDSTAERARASGAEVVWVPRPGYGEACRRAIAHLGDWPDVLAFVDADGSSRPEEMGRLLQPLKEEQADLVIGCRPRREHMTPPQRWGNRIAVEAIRLRWGHRFADIGPYRAISRPAFERLGMRDRTWGWTVEMQILGLRHGLRIVEVPVAWEARMAGASKISGTVSGVLRAGSRILWTILRYGLR